jgi:AraC family transcriptional regulator
MMAEDKEPSMESYAARMNRVIDYIDMHLGEELELDSLASIACFSKYHFHRLFAAHAGETLGSFIQRLRLEKAAGLLCDGSGRTVTEIALGCGFSGSASFARAFKERYGMSASAWRLAKESAAAESNTGKEEGKGGQAQGKARQSRRRPEVYASYAANAPQWRLTMDTTNASVQLKTLAPCKVAYVRHVGPYAGDSKLFESLFNKLFAWAGARELIKPEAMSLIIYHDSPELVAPEKLRTSVCLTVPEGTEGSGDVGIMELEGGKYGVGRFTCAADEYGQAWTWMYGDWLPQSGFVPDDRACFEAYPEPALPDGRFVVDIWVPVKPA